MQNRHTSTEKYNSQKNIVDKKLSKPTDKIHSEAEASSSKNRFQLLPTLENTEEPMDLGVENNRRIKDREKLKKGRRLASSTSTEQKEKKMT